MKHSLPYLSIFFMLLVHTAFSQEIQETNTDTIYQIALQKYQQAEFESSLDYTQRGLELAPDYHDIRILEIRNLWALEEYQNAENDLDYLITNAPEYPGVKELTYRHVSYRSPEESVSLLQRLSAVYPNEPHFKSLEASYLLKMKEQKKARQLALETIKQKNLSADDRYMLQNILKRTVSNEIGINYQYIHFNEEYSRNNPWQSYSAEYQHSFGKTVMLGRATYTDRSYDQGSLYELEAYPVFSDKFYAFTNIGFSDGSLFPDFRSSISLYYNFAKAFEAEAGGRLLHYSDRDFFTGILGLTLYTGNLYLNFRSFLGPERANKLVQNYQFNVRYYLSDADNYLFARLGSGISPDERTIFTQVQDNPDLNAYYMNAGINKVLGTHHIIQLSGGILTEDLSYSEKQGVQLVANLGYRYRF